VGFYQILGVDKNIEVRVAAGKAGFIREFENAVDPLLTRILEFCEKERSFLRVSELQKTSSQPSKPENTQHQLRQFQTLGRNTTSMALQE